MYWLINCFDLVIHWEIAVLLEHSHAHAHTRSAREVVLISFLFCLAMFRTSLLINWVIIILLLAMLSLTRSYTSVLTYIRTYTHMIHTDTRASKHVHILSRMISVCRLGVVTSCLHNTSRLIINLIVQRVHQGWSSFIIDQWSLRLRKESWKGDRIRG